MSPGLTICRQVVSIASDAVDSGARTVSIAEVSNSLYLDLDIDGINGDGLFEKVVPGDRSQKKCEAAQPAPSLTGISEVRGASSSLGYG